MNNSSDSPKKKWAQRPGALVGCVLWFSRNIRRVAHKKSSPGYTKGKL